MKLISVKEHVCPYSSMWGLVWENLGTNPRFDMVCRLWSYSKVIEVQLLNKIAEGLLSAVRHVSTPSKLDGVFMKKRFSVLICDVDGVLNTLDSPSYLPLNRKRLRILKRIVKETGCKIVVSSTWRKLPETRKRLVRALGYRGLSVHGWTTTEYFMERQIRGHEIQKWLDEHQPIDSYCIVDDDCDMLPEQMDNFVRTDPMRGLTDEDANQIIRILNNEKH